MSALTEQAALPRQAAETMAVLLAALQLALTAQEPQLPVGVPYEAKVMALMTPEAQNMLSVERLISSAQKGEASGAEPPVTVVLTSQSASAGGKEPAGGPARISSTSSLSTQ